MAREMKVGQVVQTLDRGGLEHLVIQFSEQLQRRGIRSPIIVLTGGTLVDAARQRGCEVFVLGKREGFDRRVLVALSRLVRSEGIDLIHSHNLAPLVYGTLAARWRRIRAVNTRHGRAALTAHPLIWALTDRVVAVSEDARRQLLMHNRIDADKVTVVTNAIDLSAYRPTAALPRLQRADLGIPEEAAIIGTVGRLAREKDHHTLLLALRSLADRGDAPHLIIAGDGPLAGELTGQVRGLALGGRVHLLGDRSDVPDLLAIFDLFVLPSRMEGISLTLIEAMAAGLPVVATRVGGNPEVVVEGRTGLLVEAGNPTALADALHSLLIDQDAAGKMGQRGRQIAEERFDIGRLVDEYVAIYREVGACH